MIDYLLKEGAETLFSDNKDRTVIHYACIIGVSKNILQLLLDYNEKLTLEKKHLEEALVEINKRKININDFPLRTTNRRPTRLIIAPSIAVEKMDAINEKSD